MPGDVTKGDGGQRPLSMYSAHCQISLLRNMLLPQTIFRPQASFMSQASFTPQSMLTYPKTFYTSETCSRLLNRILQG